MPQFFFMFVGVSGAFLYLMRLARGPYISWDRKNNPEQWNNLETLHVCNRVCGNMQLEGFKDDNNLKGS
uniref:Uncharacterized protein n=1 Tax=Cyprinus carpio TaxID=7962 RepID=A0A8C2J7T1_CYPCA